MNTANSTWNGLYRVLVVDADQDFLDLLTHSLEANGYAIETTTDSPGCMQLMASFMPHVTIMDIGKESAGVALLEKLTRDFPDMPVITTTVDNAADAAISSLRGGAVDYLLKPVQTPDVISRLQLALAKRDMMTKLNRLSTIIEQSRWVVMSTDRNGKVRYANPHCLALLDKSMDDLQGTMPELLEASHVGDHAANLLLKTVRSGGSLNREIDFTAADGKVYRLRGTVSRLDRESDESVLAFDDITEEHRLAAHIAHSSRHDRVSGTLTRDVLETEVQQAISEARHSGDPAVLAIVDLNYFKLINRLYGFEAGDQLLRGFADLISELAGDSVSVGRTGADEFGVLFKSSTVSDSRDMLTDLFNRMNEIDTGYFEFDIQLGFSAGLAAATTRTLDGAELMAQAEACCMKARAHEGFGLVVHDIEEAERAQQHEDATWVARLQQALATQSLRLHHQPIISLNAPDGPKRMSEVLVRFRNSSGKDVPAAMFLNVAERYQLMGGIDRWVMRKVVSLLQVDWPAASRPDLCLINLSGSSIRDPEFKRFALELLDDCGIDATRIGFEISESDALYDLDATLDFVHSLKERGCRFALDDFGTSLSAINSLHRLPVDYVKLDGAFVRQMLDEPASATIIRSVHEIARLTGKKVIAECVENDQTLDVLREMGVDYAQGYGIERPGPVPEVKSHDVPSLELVAS